jgi:pimeloyl-ACP methyl ester carboxylesterase
LEQMAAASLAVLDAEGIERCAILAYSTGSQVAAVVLARHAERFTRAVLGGIGNEFHFGWGRRFVPEERSPRPIFGWFPRRNARSFLWWLWNEPVALTVAFAALYDGQLPVEPGIAERVVAPVLIVNGTRDGFARSAPALAARMPLGALGWISGRNHVTTIGDRRFKQLATEFLVRDDAPA